MVELSAFESVVSVPQAKRKAYLEDILRRAKIRRPSKKAEWLVTNVEMIVGMGGVSRFGYKDVLPLAKEFGLHEEPSAFAEVSAPEALSLVTSILHKDMAYGQPLMTEDRARNLVERFFASFGDRSR